MKRLLLPLVMVLTGLGGGIGAGLAFRPGPRAEAALENPCGPAAGQAADQSAHQAADQAAGHAASEAPVVGPEGELLHDYVKLNNQFIVPVVSAADVKALVVLSLSLELPQGMSERVYALEPKLRDSLLQVLFDHANSGGFDGAFTAGTTMDQLRRALLDMARKVVGPEVTDVLIEDIVRQDG